MTAEAIYKFVLSVMQVCASVAGFTAALYGYRAIRDWRIEAIGRRKIEIVESLWSNAAQLVSWMQALRAPEAAVQNKQVLEEINKQTVQYANQLTTEIERLKLYSDEVNVQLISEWADVILALRRRLELACKAGGDRGHNCSEYSALLMRSEQQNDSISIKLNEALEHIRQICRGCISHPKQVRKVCFVIPAKPEENKI